VTKIRDEQAEVALTRRLESISVADEKSDGWKTDAHKNLPGFREAYLRYPDMDWYFMIDDDTYVLWNNLFDVLDSYDPSKPWYMGLVYHYVGCDEGSDREKNVFVQG
jgi:hypothetical protein